MGWSKKTDYKTKITEIENKMPSVTGLVTAVALITKATEIENKIPDFTNWATKAALITRATEIEKITPDTTSFVATPEFNGLAKVSFDAGMKEATKGLASKS